MQETDPNKAINAIIMMAPEFAQAKANRVFLEESRKSKKATLMRSCDEAVLGKQETYAYSHPEYLELLEEIYKAVEAEERLRLMIAAAQARIEIYKVNQYTARAEMKAFS
jgi:hypothetical protein